MTDDASVTTSRTVDGDNNLDGEHEAPRLILAFEARNPPSSAVRLMLSETDEVQLGRGTRAWARSGRTLELRISDSEISRQHARLARHPVTGS